MSQNTKQWKRRTVLRGLVLASSGLALGAPGSLLAQAPDDLDVASAGSLRAILDGPLKEAAAAALRLTLRSQTGGADSVARALVDGSLASDVFLSVTASPMRILQEAGLAETAYAFAGTELVLLYSPKSRFASAFLEAAGGKRSWLDVLQEPGLRFGRSNPLDDPSGRAVIFMMMLAEKKYNVPGLVGRVLGAPLNPEQVQTGAQVRAGLEQGSIDVVGGYRIATAGGKLPFITLPGDVNLSEVQVQERRPELVLKVREQEFHPEPLLFYAASLHRAAHPARAVRFVEWLQGEQAGQLLLESGFTLPSHAAPLKV